jgi:hypothetical protein
MRHVWFHRVGLESPAYTLSLGFCLTRAVPGCRTAAAMANSASSARRFLVISLSWLIPGYGYLIHRRWGRGIFFFVILEATFLAGAAFHGSVLLPDFRFGSEGFNVVTILTFLTQMFNGGMSLISLLPEFFGAKAAILPYDETNQWADLGSFFLLVSGGMNYFVMTSTYDHFYGRKSRGPVAAALDAQ